MKKRVTVACDLPDHLLGNRVFQEDVQRAYPWGESFWIILRDLINARGWEIMTADIFLNNPTLTLDTICFYISYMQTSRTDELKKRAIPLLLYSLESPNVALRFYANIRTISSRYKYSILFRGVSSHVNAQNKSLPLFWPNTIKTVLENKEWSRRRLLCMIASNKRKYDVEPGPFTPLRALRKRIAIHLVRFKAPFLTVKDLYDLRLEAIDFFSDKDFSLFGAGWDQQRGLTKHRHARIKSLAPIRIDDKIQTLKNYKYCICFENCSSPGYVTEKIFDALFAGVIPVYMGAPDIEDFVPKNCFIHFTDYKDFNELYRYLSDLTPEQSQTYLNAAASFLKSRDFLKFTDDYMAQQIFQFIVEGHAALTNCNSSFTKYSEYRVRGQQNHTPSEKGRNIHDKH